MVSLGAQESFLRERTILTTDRNAYAAGEQILCSAFCMDSPGNLSQFSAVAYIELVGAEGTVATAKFALASGRGAGSVQIPSGVPTGNYRLTAYTATNRNEKGYDYMTGSRVISVYNTSSTLREKDLVKVVDGLSAADSALPASGDISASVSVDGAFTVVKLIAGKNASVSVSVFHDQGLPRYSPASISSLEQNAWDSPTMFEPTVPGEYDGEIIRLRLGESSDSSSFFLSSPGSRSDIYKGRKTSGGIISFFTDNIFGDKDIAVISRASGLASDDVSIVSPFISPSATDIPVMEIAPSMRAALETLDAASRIKKAFDADTLYQLLPLRKLDPLKKYHSIYVIDDYTRFATMREVFIEYLHDIRINKENGQIRMEVKTVDSKGVATFQSYSNSLILLDGVPVFDHQIIYDMDPASLKAVEIYPYNYSFGSSYFIGAANFVTLNGDLAATDLGRGVRIFSFKGISVPRAYTAASAAGNPSFPRRDETLFWHPAITLREGMPSDLKILNPSYRGTFKLVVEGLCGDGTPIYLEKSFEIE